MKHTDVDDYDGVYDPSDEDTPREIREDRWFEETEEISDEAQDLLDKIE